MGIGPFFDDRYNHFLSQLEFFKKKDFSEAYKKHNEWLES